MRWVKQGLVLQPKAQAGWIGTHAALPCVARCADGDRLYFSSRDSRNRSHIGFARWSGHGPVHSTAVSPRAVLSPGALGAFDDAGVTMSCLVAQDGRWFLY